MTSYLKVLWAKQPGLNITDICPGLDQLLRGFILGSRIHPMNQHSSFTSMARPDLSLPEHVPEMEEYQHQPMDGKPFPLYTLARAAALDMEVVCERCNAKCDDDIIKQTRPAPVTPTNRFVDQPLKEVVDFHRNMIRDDDWDKLYFAVVTEDDWATKGLLLVTLGFNTECRPDAFFLPAEDVGITLLNLQVGTTDWEETRYGYESHNESNKNDDPDDIKSNDQDDSSSARGSRENDETKVGQAIDSNKDKTLIDGDQSSCFLVYNGNSPPQTAGLVLDVLDPDWQKKYYKAGERFVEGRIPWSRGYKTPSH